MSFYVIMGAIIAIGGGISAFFFRKGGLYNPTMPSTDNITEVALKTPEPDPVSPETVESPSAPFNHVSELLWDTAKHSYHSTRILCDDMGLNFDQKNEICATIYGESEFNNNAICKNRNAKGEVTSIDVGLCQINSYWHTGPGKEFPSTVYVVAHPEEAVRFMIRMFKAGKIDLWVAHKNGRYQQFLKPDSLMWA